MVHFRQGEVIYQEFEKLDGSPIVHNYKGVDYEVTPENLLSLDPRVIQSLSTRLRRENPKPKPTQVPAMAPANGEASDDKGQGFDNREQVKLNRPELIKQEILRLATTEIIVEEKLNYPKVFQKLITEPYLSLEQFRRTYDSVVEIYLFIDRATGYNRKDEGFHRTMYDVASKIKGVRVFYNNMLRLEDDGEYYLTKLDKIVPRGKKIVAFSQGCGGAWGEIPSGRHVHFVTHFKHGEDCGCDGIHYHERMEESKKSVTVHYGVDTPEKLKLLKF